MLRFFRDSQKGWVAIARDNKTKSVAKLEPLDIVRLVLWFGIIAGTAEVALLAVFKFGSLASAPVGWANPDDRLRHSYLWLSPHVVWMAPVMLSAFLAFPAILLALAGRNKNGDWSVQNTVGYLTFLCFVSMLFFYPRLYAVAVLLLAGGAAVQVARLVGAHQAGFLRMVRRTTGWMVATVALVALTMVFGGALRERTRLGALAASRDGAPNVLLLILDTVRAANMSLYGYSKETTPNLESLAANGVTFDMALSTSPWTLPSHVSMFTGLLPYEFNTNFLIPYTGEHTTLAEHLDSRGYETAGFVANLVYCAYESGITRGFLHYRDYPITATELLFSTALGRRLARSPMLHRLASHYDVFGDRDATTVTGDFLDWVGGRTDDRPFFAFLNYMDAHEPYLPPARFERQFGTGTPRRHDLNNYFLRWATRPGRGTMSAEEVRAEVAAYDGTIAYIDEQIGVLLDELQANGMLQNTVVIVASDHGEQFGEHGLHVHGNSLYLPNLHVPLVIVYGDHLPAGTRVGTPVSIRDIPATVMSLAGIEGTSPFPGQSLERHWMGAVTDSGQRVEPIFSELTDIRGAPNYKSLLFGRYHYIWGENRTEFLFDIKSDPGELTSLMTRENLELANRMRQLMGTHIRNDAALWERLPQNDE